MQRMSFDKLTNRRGRPIPEQARPFPNYVRLPVAFPVAFVPARTPDRAFIRRRSTAQIGPSGPSGWHGACPYSGGITNTKSRKTVQQRYEQIQIYQKIFAELFRFGFGSVRFGLAWPVYWYLRPLSVVKPHRCKKIKSRRELIKSRRDLIKSRRDFIKSCQDFNFTLYLRVAQPVPRRHRTCTFEPRSLCLGGILT